MTGSSGYTTQPVPTPMSLPAILLQNRTTAVTTIAVYIDNPYDNRLFRNRTFWFEGTLSGAGVTVQGRPNQVGAVTFSWQDLCTFSAIGPRTVQHNVGEVRVVVTGVGASTNITVVMT